MQLYYAPGSISVAAAITLREAGIDHELIRVDFASAEQTKPAYHAINPKGRVPALATPVGVVTETGAILEYVAASAPEAGLVPQDALQAARMREVIYFLASTMHVNHAHKMRGYRWADNESSWADMTAKVTETMRASASHVEANCLVGPYVLGERFSIVDPYLYVVCSWLPGDGLDLVEFPAISAFMDAMSTRPSVRSVKSDGLM